MEIVQQLSGSVITYAFLFLLLAVPATFIFAVWKRTDIDQAAKILWMIFFIVAPFFSILIYLLVGYKKRTNY